MEKGDVFYSAYFYDKRYTGETSKVVLEEWVISLVDKRGAHLVLKEKGVTWGKLSSKKGDYGLMLNNVPKNYRKFVAGDESFNSHNLYREPKAAYKVTLDYINAELAELNRVAGRVKTAMKK